MAYLYKSFSLIGFLQPFKHSKRKGILKKNKFSGVLISMLFLTNHWIAGQSIMEMIDHTSNATFTAIACDSELTPIDTAHAFFISADGLAITSASLLQNADTLIFTDHQNRRLSISRVIAIHQWANLALIQINGMRNRDNNYLIPERSSFETPSEILAFTWAEDVKHALTYGEIISVFPSDLFGRGATITVKNGNASRAAPIINPKGQFIGIYGNLSSQNRGIMLSSHIINDENWTSVNVPWHHFKRHIHKSRLTTSVLFQAAMLQEIEFWLESARMYTTAIRIFPERAELYAFRAICRYQYGNQIGGEEDCNKAISMDSKNAVPYMARAVNHINQKRFRSALEDLITCAEHENPPTQAWFLLGQIQSLHNQVREAYASFTFAIEQDSLYCKAYYERGRLLMQHASDQERALSDFLFAARLNNFLPGVHTLIGNIRLNQMDYLEAINDFNKALRSNPEDVHALMNRGIAYYNTGLKEQACEDWDTAGRHGNTQAFRLISRHCSELRRTRITTVR